MNGEPPSSASHIKLSEGFSGHVGEFQLTIRLADMLRGGGADPLRRRLLERVGT